MFTKLHIEYANPANLHDSIVLSYLLRPTDITQRWVNKVLKAQQQYPIDEPTRFYGFGSYESQVQYALDRINHCITLIKQSMPEISKEHITDVNDQDLLNFWHHVFEIHHGLLGKEDTNNPLTPVLGDLNVCVHRCESVARGAQPRHVVTYYGLPKTDMYNLEDYDHMQFEWQPGTVFLNYVEIGKTLEDLAFDNDQYIAPGAFQPFKHYSADFVVRFFEQTSEEANKKRAIINSYYESHRDYFGNWRIQYAPGNIAVADIIGSIPFKELELRQYIKSISFT